MISYAIEQDQRNITRHWVSMRRLMISLLLGYIVIAALFLSKTEFNPNILISVLFLFGSVFVYLAVNLSILTTNKLVKTLHGIIPICAGCKKVKEQNQWKQIETYISERASADFTHSLCPDCMKKSLSGRTDF